MEDYFHFTVKIKTLVTRHLACYRFDYQRIVKVMSG